MANKRTFFGCDIGKASINWSEYGGSCAGSIPNDAPSLAQWLQGLPAGSAIAMEATGCYHQLLAGLAHARGLLVYVINPAWIRHYAVAIGARAKTDRVDAPLIARYVHTEHAHLIAWRPLAPAQRALAELLARRQALVRARQALELSLGSMSCLTTERQALFGTLRAMITALDVLIAKTLAQDAELAALNARLQTIVGVGPVLAAQLSQVLTHLHFRSASALIAYSGLDPRPDESGRRVGRRRLSKHGHAYLRALLYTAGMAASHSRLWRAHYRGLIARGLASTAAFCILGRRIARIAFALFKSNTNFDPTRVLPCA